MTMTSNRVDEALIIPPPRRQIVLATVAAVGAIILPPEWYSGWIKIHNDDASAKLGIKLGLSSAEVSAMTTLTAVSTVTSSLPDTPAGTPGDVIHATMKEQYFLPDLDWGGSLSIDNRIWLGYLSSATGGFLRITQTSGPTKA